MSELELVQDAGTLCPREKSCGICQGLKISLAVQFLQVLLTLLLSMDSKGRVAVPCKHRHTKIPVPFPAAATFPIVEY